MHDQLGHQVYQRRGILLGRLSSGNQVAGSIETLGEWGGHRQPRKFELLSCPCLRLPTLGSATATPGCLQAADDRRYTSWAWCCSVGWRRSCPPTHPGPAGATWAQASTAEARGEQQQSEFDPSLPWSRASRQVRGGAEERAWSVLS